MDIESIIRKIVDSNFSMYEQERLTVLNALMGNIDILMNRSDEWFGNNIPEEYSRVIRSLFSLSAFLLEKKSNRFDFARIDKFQEIDIHLFLEQLVNELSNILDFGEMKIYPEIMPQKIMIRSSEVILKESFYNIFFSIYPFMKEDSTCRINLNENTLNITVEFVFEKLSSFFPGASEIKKNLYSYIQGSFEKIGIGIDSSVSSLRNAGAIVRINELSFKDRFSLSIMFPALDFYSEIESLRGVEQNTGHNIYSGEILLNMQDPFMKLFITDVLHEYGYSVKPVSLKDMSAVSSSSVKAFIHEYHAETGENSEALSSISAFSFKKILICNENHIHNKPYLENFSKIIKPFNVEELIDLIENE